MGNEQNSITERIIKLTLNILYLLFQEDYIILKKSGHQLSVARHSRRSTGCTKNQTLNMEPSSNTPEKYNTKMILKFINKITELLTGEVPIRCQDVAVYFSMEEWEYVNRDKYVYRDIMIENQHRLTPTGSARQSAMPAPCSTDEDYEIVITAVNYPSGGNQMEYFTSYQEEHLPHSEDPAAINPLQNLPRNIKTPACMFMNLFMKISTVLADHTYALSPMKARALLNKQGHRLDLNSSSDITKSSAGDNMAGSVIHEENLPAPFLAGNNKPEAVFNEEQNLQTQYLAVNYKEEAFLYEEKHMAHDPPTHVDSEYIAVCVKEEPIICKEEPPEYTDFTTSQDTNQDTLIPSTLFKEEPIPCPVFFPYTSTYPSSAPVQYNFAYIKEEPMSGEEAAPAEIEVFADGTHCPSDHPKKRSKKINSKHLPLTCNECGKRFKQKSGLSMHRKIHTRGDRYTCHDCGKCFLNRTKLAKHQKIHTVDKPYSCNECGKRFSKPTNLSNHQRIHATKNPFSCAICGKQFISASNLHRHQKKHDANVSTTGFAALECGEEFDKEHEMCPTSDKPYACNECGKRFIKRINLVKHQRLHTKKNLHNCQECGKYFMSRAYLLRHMKSHGKKKIRSCSCQLCGKYFLSKLDLTIHQRIHRGERPSTASEWRKSFIRKLGFVIQESSNVGEKPYLCQVCGEQFEKKLQLLRHQKSHNEEKPFSGFKTERAEP